MGDKGRNAPSRAPTRTCFIGNLPWDITEPQLRELFAEVGPIKHFRLVTDRDTGKPKGFGFCEYFDIPTASAAQRNLNNHDLSGRKIHVDFAEDKERGGPRMNAPVGMDPAQRAAGSMSTIVDGGQAASQGGAPDAITSTLAGMSRKQLYEIMSQMKGLIQQNPGQARQILVQNPQLTKALFQAQIMLGMVPTPPGADSSKPNGVQQPVPYNPPPQLEPGYNPVPIPPQRQYTPPPHQQQQYNPPAPQYSQAQSGGYGGGDYGYQEPAAPVQQHGYGGGDPRQPQMMEYQPAGESRQAYGLGDGGGSGPVADPHQQHLPGSGAPVSDPRQQHYTPPYSPSQVQHGQQEAPPQQQLPPQQAPNGQLDADQQKALLAQVMNLTPAQIELLPLQQKAQVIALQQQLRQQGASF